LIGSPLATLFPPGAAEEDQQEHSCRQSHDHVQEVGKRSEDPEEQQSKSEELKPIPKVWAPAGHFEGKPNPAPPGFKLTQCRRHLTLHFVK